MDVLLCLGKKTLLRPHYEEKLLQHVMNKIVARYSEPWEVAREEIHQLYERCRGVLLTGGADIDPARYGISIPAEITEDIDAGRDTLDLTVLDWAYQDKKPVFAICRGAQMLWVHSGGKLIPHIPAYMNPQLEKHSKEEIPKDLEALTDNLVWLNQGSRIYEIVGSHTIQVRCAHHQAVADQLNGRLQITAYSQFGIPEAVESMNREHFCIGVQFHPEVGSGSTDLLFRAFAQACNKYQK